MKLPINCSNLEATLPFPEITTGEVYQAIFQAKSSTPGQDEISNAVLKKAWPALGPHISALYKHCAAAGWHSTPFHQALLVALPKPGKKDYSSPHSYRLIALLSTLGKKLECLIAQRLILVSHQTEGPPPPTIWGPPLPFSYRPGGSISA